MLSCAEEKEATDLLQNILRCNTTNPPGNEAVLAEKIRKWLAGEEIICQIDEIELNRANIIFEIKGATEGPKLLVTGHLDTVPPGNCPWQHDPFGAEIEDGLIYGRGASDMKGSVAAMLYAIARMKRKGIIPKQNIVFLGTAGEEMFCQGALHFVDKNGMEKIGAVLVGEPSNGDLLLAHKGAAWLEVNTYGKTAHGSMPDLGVNAVMSMNAFLNALVGQSFQVEPHPLLGLPTISVNKIDGGVAINVVPDSCTCKIDIRTIPGQTEEDVRKLIDKAMAEAAKSCPELKADYKFLCSLPSVGCIPNDKIIDCALECADRELVQRGVNYFTDASALIGKRQMPLIIYGPGDDKQAHQPDENLSMAKYFEAIEFYEKFLTEYSIK
ncbi:MAG: M20 family metallopeptidase [Acholeplasmataceae bacterium]|nr:M20 family metallopeptidase [Acholeplasmataceae bacterium]